MLVAELSGVIANFCFSFCFFLFNGLGEEESGIGSLPYDDVNSERT